MKRNMGNEHYTTEDDMEFEAVMRVFEIIGFAGFGTWYVLELIEAEGEHDPMCGLEGQYCGDCTRCVVCGGKPAKHDRMLGTWLCDPCRVDGDAEYERRYQKRQKHRINHPQEENDDD